MKNINKPLLPDSPTVLKIKNLSENLAYKISESQKNINRLLENIQKWTKDPLFRRSLTGRTFLNIRHQRETFKARIRSCEETKKLLIEILQRNFLLYFNYPYDERSSIDTLENVISFQKYLLECFQNNENFLFSFQFFRKYPSDKVNLYKVYLEFVDDVIHQEILNSVKIRFSI